MYKKLNYCNILDFVLEYLQRHIKNRSDNNELFKNSKPILVILIACEGYLIQFRRVILLRSNLRYVFKIFLQFCSPKTND